MKTQRKKIKVEYFWANGRKGKMYVEESLLGTIYKALRDDTARIFDITCNGLNYQDYVHINGGLVVSA